MNREEWLLKLAEKMRPYYQEFGETFPAKLRITCGWPSKGAFSSKRRRVGECWSEKASADGHIEIFISPCVSDSVEVGGILAHELIHGCGHHHHKASFKRCAVKMGLTGKMTATEVSPELRERLNGMIQDIGPYPHGVLDKTQSPRKKDGTRMIKLVCTAPGCGYTVRTTQKWIEYGMPTCPCESPLDIAE